MKPKRPIIRTASKRIWESYSLMREAKEMKRPTDGMKMNSAFL